MNANRALRNWAGNVTFGPKTLAQPGSIDELLEIVANATADGDTVRAVGALHSFSRVADGGATMIAMDALDRVVDVNHDDGTVTVEGGIRYAALAEQLGPLGMAIHNLPSLPHVSVAGAVATATHGSGDANQNLAAHVVSVDVVSADGEISTIDSDDARFAGVPVGLGALGVVARVQLRTEPAFEVAQHVYRDLRFAVGVDHLDEVLASAYSVSLFTDWTGDVFHQVWCKERVDAQGPRPSDLFGAPRFDLDVHPLPSMSAAACTRQVGKPGPWYERLPHFRPGFTPSAGDELQAEYLIDRRHGPEALRAVARLGDRLVPLTLVTEVRSVAADGLWLSTAYGVDSLAIHFTFRPDEAEVLVLLADIERALAPFAPRPHWGKLTAMSGHDVRALYPRFDQFLELRRTLDPTGAFGNLYVDWLADDS